MAEELRVAAAELVSGEMRSFEVGDRHVAVVRDGDDVYAFEDDCSHRHCPLTDGEFREAEVECVCHGSVFDLTTGEPSNPPATEPIDVFDARLEGDDIVVTVG